MMNIKHQFISEIPQSPQERILYISIKYKVAVHLCACGCKNKVVTRLSPKDWKLTFDGISATLYPSIGNWNFNCKSHYWIENDTVIIAPSIRNKRKKENAFFTLKTKFRKFIKEFTANLNFTN